MAKWRWVLAILGGIYTISHGQSLADYRPKTPLAIPSWTLGASYHGRYYSNVMEHWADVEFVSRINRHWALSGQVGAQGGDPGFMGTLGFRWLPDGRIGRVGYENWIEVRAGSIARKTENPDDPGCDHCDLWLKSPIAFIVYGRDFLPWDKAGWGVRFGIYGGVAMGNALFRHETGIFGMDQTTFGWLMIGFQAGLFNLKMKDDAK